MAALAVAFRLMIVRPHGTVVTAVPVEQELTVMVIAVLVAVVGAAQVALLVNIQVTAWPLVKDEVVKTEELVPAFVPFTCH